MADPAGVKSGGWRVGYAGAPEAASGVNIAAPWLAGEPADGLFKDAEFRREQHGVRCFESGGLLIGTTGVAFEAGQLAAATEALYQNVFAVCGPRHLWRVWNYLPEINAIVNGLENYRAFCLGRAAAFERAFGSDFPRRLSAASAVGSDGRELQVIFVAGETPGHHVENPEQIAAYRYPVEHGPRSPSFARATVARGKTAEHVFISGTAAIKGHATVAPDSFDEQLACTLDNLRLISREAGLGDRLGAESGGRRYFKIYLRKAADLAATQAALRHDLLRATDHVTYLRSDICRRALDIEIEATVVQAR